MSVGELVVTFVVCSIAGGACMIGAQQIHGRWRARRKGVRDAE